jgi:exodeoxyribonuclease VII large subunit
MTTLSEAASPAGPTSPSNVPEFSVTEISQALKRTVEGEFGHVRVRGEISGFKQAASGHLYMTLKDENSVLDAVCWRGTAGRLSVRPEDGLEIIATGRLTTYPGRSKYQIVIEAVELAGEGALLKLLEDRRRQLAEEGLFDADRKQDLPFLPDVIGVVTSPTGAVIRDILHRLADRFPRHVLIWPVLVQGDGAATQVASAISGFNALPPDGPVPRPDLLIVARGGGSLEDLWSFNEEVVVRAAAASTIPLISAVGHETDTTLIDFASDRRAPTPTAAAEMAVPVRAELLAQITDDSRRLIGAMHRMVEERRLRLEGLGRGLPEPRTLIESGSQRLDDRVERLGNAIRGWLRQQHQQLALAGNRISRRALDEQITRGRERGLDLAARLHAQTNRRIAESAARLDQAAALLNSLSYERVLERGFTMVQSKSGAPVTTVADASPGTEVSIRFHDGSAAARVEGAPVKPKLKPKRAARKPSSPDDSQGTLL